LDRKGIVSLHLLQREDAIPVVIEGDARLVSEYIDAVLLIRHFELVVENLSQNLKTTYTMADHNALLQEVTKAPQLKHAETVDKSKPVVDPNVHIKTVDRTGFLSEVAQPHDLKHAETVDKSKPVVDSTVHIKTVDRKGFLTEIETAAAKK
jgi:hypothetical protein